MADLTPEQIMAVHQMPAISINGAIVAVFDGQAKVTFVEAIMAGPTMPRCSVAMTEQVLIGLRDSINDCLSRQEALRTRGVDVRLN